MAWRWVRSTAADFALVALNWLLLGALLVPLRVLFPHVRSFEYAAGAPVSLLGIALLHAALITLMGYTEGLYAGGERSAEAGPHSRQVRGVGDDSVVLRLSLAGGSVGHKRFVLGSGLAALWRAVDVAMAEREAEPSRAAGRGCAQRA